MDKEFTPGDPVTENRILQELDDLCALSGVDATTDFTTVTSGDFNKVILECLSNVDDGSIQRAAAAGTEFTRRCLKAVPPTLDTLELFSPEEVTPDAKQAVWLAVNVNADWVVPGWYDPSGDPLWGVQAQSHDGPAHDGATRRLLASYTIASNNGLPSFWAYRKLPEQQPE